MSKKARTGKHDLFEPAPVNPLNKLVEAIKINDQSGIEQALIDGANINHVYGNGNSLLMEMMNKGMNSETFEFLATQGALINYRNPQNNRTVFMEAAAQGQEEIIRLYFNSSRFVTETDEMFLRDNSNRTSLMLLLDSGCVNMKLIMAFLEHDSQNVNQVDSVGRTVFTRLCERARASQPRTEPTLGDYQVPAYSEHPYEKNPYFSAVNKVLWSAKSYMEKHGVPADQTLLGEETKTFGLQDYTREWVRNMDLFSLATAVLVGGVPTFEESREELRKEERNPTGLVRSTTAEPKGRGSKRGLGEG